MRWVGTQEMIHIRQDFCRLDDCIRSDHTGNVYFTGSKAEGLNLPGSDQDYMFDENTNFQIKVVQTLQEIHVDDRNHNFLLCTDNVPLGFALLLSVNQSQSPNCIITPCLQNINGMHLPCLSSNLFVQLYHKLMCKIPERTHKRQGPSIEISSLYNTEFGTDNVPSIHCTFWPNSASEWTQRPRHFGLALIT